jgi:transposase
MEQLHTVLTEIDCFDKEIERVASALPDYALFKSLPGPGPHLALRLLAAFGEQRESFHGADELQKYSGIAPVTERSGKKSRVHWRWQCQTFPRQTDWSRYAKLLSAWPPCIRSDQRLHRI